MIYINNINNNKNIIFILNIFAAFAKYYIILVPLITLKKDLLNRARRVEINAVSWEKSTYYNKLLLVALYESMKNDEFVN